MAEKGIEILSDGTFKVDQSIIKKVIDWWNLPGTQKVFYGYHISEQINGKLDGETQWQIRRNTIRGKIAEICEHVRLGIPIVWENILRSDIKGDGGIDLIHNNKKLDVKSRDGRTFGFLISQKKFDINLNVYFCGYTVLHPFYKANINENLEYMIYEYTGVIHSSDLVKMRSSIKMKIKFKKMIDVPASCFEMNVQKQIRGLNV